MVSQIARPSNSNNGVFPIYPRKALLMNFITSSKEKLFFLVLIFIIINSSVNAGINAPYLQSCTDTSIIINWKQESMESARVLFGQTESFSDSVVSSSYMIDQNYFWYTAQLNNLNPNTTYYYQIVNSSDKSDVYKFKTFPEKGNTEGNIRILVRSDNQSGYQAATQIVEAMEDKVTQRFGQNYHEEIDFIFNVGDIVGNGLDLDEYQPQYFEPIAQLTNKIPSMVSIGNHERESPYFYKFMKYEQFAGVEGEAYYSFNCGRVKIIALNSNPEWRNDTQIDWLDDQLDEAERDDEIDWVFTFCHHPPYSSVWTPGNTAYISDRVVPLLNEYSKAPFLINGHTHAYERGATIEESLRLMVVGGAGGSIDRWSRNLWENYPQHHRTFDHHHWVLLDIDVPEKTCQVEAFSLGHSDKPLYNAKIDSFVHKLEPPAPPAQPIISQQPDSIQLPHTVQANDFSGLSSQIQISNSENDFSSPMFDIKRDYENYFLDTGAPDWEPIDQNAGIKLDSYELNMEEIPFPGTYFMRIRYRDFDLQWSQWSEPELLNIVETGFELPKAYNKLLEFTGNKGYLEVASELSDCNLPTKGITVETWVKLFSHPTWGGYIGAFQDNGGYEKGWVLGNYNQQFSFALSSEGADDGDGSLTYVTSDQNFEYDKWYHLAASYDGETIRLYINGILMATDGTQNGDILYDSQSFFNIGTYHDDNENFILNGQLDETRLWNKALTQEEIQNWMHKEINSEHSHYDNLISSWSYNSTDYDKTYDLKGQHDAKYIDINPIQIKNSTSPVGLKGSLLRNNSVKEIDGLFVKSNTSITYQNYLGLYLINEPDSSNYEGEILPESVNFRVPKTWGIFEYGDCNADFSLKYEDESGILHLLKRNNINSEWQDISNQAQFDDSSKTFTLLGQDSFGEYTIGIEQTSRIESSDAVNAHKYRLQYNYPNPFNPETNIAFSLPRKLSVYLEIYDIRGKKVATLYSGTKLNAGQHNVIWNGKNDYGLSLSSGIYFCRLKSDIGTKIIKMTLNK